MMKRCFNDLLYMTILLGLMVVGKVSTLKKETCNKVLHDEEVFILTFFFYYFVLITLKYAEKWYT